MALETHQNQNPKKKIDRHNHQVSELRLTSTEDRPEQYQLNCISLKKELTKP